MTVKVDGTKGLIQNYDYLVATTGFSYTFTTANGVILNPAATLATGAVTMPSSVVDGMTVSISTTKEITALTISGASGQTVSNAVTTLLAGGCVTYLYRAANTTWFPFSDASTTPVVDLAKSISLGWGQTWQDMSGSRSGGSVSYQNTTGKPIMVVVGDSGGGGNLQASVDNSTWVGIGGADTSSGSFSSVGGVIPNNYYYRYTGGFNGWSELR